MDKLIKLNPKQFQLTVNMLHKATNDYNLELSLIFGQLPKNGNLQTFVNAHLVYEHGYTLVDCENEVENLRNHIQTLHYEYGNVIQELTLNLELLAIASSKYL